MNANRMQKSKHTFRLLRSLLWLKHVYRSGTVNSNTVNSEFYLIKVSLKSLPDSYNFMFKMHR